MALRTPLCYSLSCYNAQRGSNIHIYADRLLLNLLWTRRLSLVDAGVGGVRVLRRHLPEGKLDNRRGVLFIARRMDLYSRSHSNSCFCKQLRISAKSGSLQVFAIHGTDFPDEAVINIHPHNDLPVYHFFFMHHNLLDQGMQKFGGHFGDVGVCGKLLDFDAFLYCG